MPTHAQHGFALPVRELIGHPGTMVTRDLDVPVPDAMALALARVVGPTLHLAVRLESVVEGILMTGQVQARAVAECSRCLDEIPSSLTTTVTELYYFPGAEGSAEDDSFVADGETIDVEQVVRDAVVLAMPSRPLCREDCPGLCVDCGQRLIDDPDHSHETTDPRWAALAVLRGGIDLESPDAGDASVASTHTSTPSSR